MLQHATALHQLYRIYSNFANRLTIPILIGSVHFFNCINLPKLEHLWKYLFFSYGTVVKLFQETLMNLVPSTEISVANKNPSILSSLVFMIGLSLSLDPLDCCRISHPSNSSSHEDFQLEDFLQDWVILHYEDWASGPINCVVPVWKAHNPPLNPEILICDISDISAFNLWRKKWYFLKYTTFCHGYPQTHHFSRCFCTNSWRILLVSHSMLPTRRELLRFAWSSRSCFVLVMTASKSSHFSIDNGDNSNKSNPQAPYAWG